MPSKKLLQLAVQLTEKLSASKKQQLTQQKKLLTRAKALYKKVEKKSLEAR